MSGSTTVEEESHSDMFGSRIACGIRKEEELAL
jgi:hypothetical protein